MRFNYVLKFIPLLSTAIIILFLTVFNQKDNSKLKILIWDTPTLSIGTYIAISSGSGFILSYLITTNLSKLNQPVLQRKVVKQINDNIDEVNDELNSNYIKYDNTLIERDIKDPSPTIKAKFRVIGISKHKKGTLINNESSVNEEYSEEQITYKTGIQKNSTLSDWDDNSYSNW